MLKNAPECDSDPKMLSPGIAALLHALQIPLIASQLKTKFTGGPGCGGKFPVRTTSDPTLKGEPCTLLTYRVALGSDDEGRSIVFVL